MYTRRAKPMGTVTRKLYTTSVSSHSDTLPQYSRSRDICFFINQNCTCFGIISSNTIASLQSRGYTACPVILDTQSIKDVRNTRCIVLLYCSHSYQKLQALAERIPVYKNDRTLVGYLTEDVLPTVFSRFTSIFVRDSKGVGLLEKSAAIIAYKHKHRIMETNTLRASMHQSGIEMDGSNYCRFGEDTEPYVDPETLCSNFALRGVMVWRSLCEYRIRQMQSNEAIVEDFASASASKVNVLKRHILSHIIPISTKASDMQSLLILLRCNDLQVQKRLTEAVSSIQLNTDARTQDVRTILQNVQLLLDALKHTGFEVTWVTHILPVLLNFLSSIIIVPLSKLTKGLLYEEFAADCTTLQETITEMSEDTTELGMADFAGPLKEMLKYIQNGINVKEVKFIRKIEEFCDTEEGRKSLTKRLSGLPYLQQYSVVFVILQQITHKITHDKVNCLRDVVGALIHKMHKKVKTERLLYPILLLVTKTVVRLLNTTNTGVVVNFEVQVESVYLQGVLNLFLDSKSISQVRRFKILDEIENLLFHKTVPISQMVMHWFERNGMQPYTIRTKTIAHVERLLTTINFKIRRTNAMPLLAKIPKWCTFQGTIGGDKDVDLFCLVPTLECLKEGIMSDYKSKADKKETDKKINSLEIQKLLQQSGTHNNILALHAFQCRPMPLFYIVDRLNGSDLLTFLLQARKEQNWCSPSLLAKIVLDAVKAVLHLQANNIIHRNLIAKSFFLDTQNRLVLTDFSIAKYVDSENVSISELECTEVATRWCSPESLLDGRYDFKSDIWMIGQLIYEIYTHGCQPFTELYGMSTSRIMELVVFHYLKPKQWPCIPKEIHDLVLSCVQADPDDRATLRDLQTSLCQYIHSGAMTKRFSVAHLRHVDDMFPVMPSQATNTEMIERGIPLLFLQLKAFPTDPRVSYQDTIAPRKRLSSGSLEVRESELVAPDRPTYKIEGLSLQVREPVTAAFVETVFPLLTGSEMKWLHVRHFPRIVHKRARAGESTCELIYGCERGDSLMDIAMSKRLGDPDDTTCKANYYNVLFQAARFVENIHSKKFLLRDICATNLYYCDTSGEVFMPRIGRIINQNSPEALDDSIIGQPFPDRRHWMPLEVLQSNQYSNGSDVYMLAMMYYEYFTALGLKDQIPAKRTLYSVPFAKVKGENLLQHLYMGEMPEKPDKCPIWFYNLMKLCWNRDRTQRPSVAVIRKRIEERITGIPSDDEESSDSDAHTYEDGDYSHLPQDNRHDEPNPNYDRCPPSTDSVASFIHPDEDERQDSSAPAKGTICKAPAREDIAENTPQTPGTRNSTCDKNQSSVTCFCSECSSDSIPAIPGKHLETNSTYQSNKNNNYMFMSPVQSKNGQSHNNKRGRSQTLPNRTMDAALIASKILCRSSAEDRNSGPFMRQQPGRRTSDIFSGDYDKIDSIMIRSRTPSLPPMSRHKSDCDTIYDKPDKFISERKKMPTPKEIFQQKDLKRLKSMESVLNASPHAGYLTAVDNT